MNISADSIKHAILKTRKGDYEPISASIELDDGYFISFEPDSRDYRLSKGTHIKLNEPFFVASDETVEIDVKGKKLQSHMFQIIPRYKLEVTPAGIINFYYRYPTVKLSEKPPYFLREHCCRDEKKNDVEFGRMMNIPGLKEILSVDGKPIHMIIGRDQFCTKSASEGPELEFAFLSGVSGREIKVKTVYDRIEEAQSMVMPKIEEIDSYVLSLREKHNDG